MTRARRSDSERGQALVFFALLIPVLFGLAAIVITLGNWITHARHLQTKVDAAAFAGGQAWAFPCGADSDTNASGTGILDVARKYVGSHVTAGGLSYTTPYNAQIGGVSGNDVHVVMNGNPYWDDDAGTSPPDQTSPAGSVCEAKILDVKATEANSFPLFGILPLFPDLKRKARIQIEESAGEYGILPIAVRIPRPLSAAAVFYNEQNDQIIDVQELREVCVPGVTYCVPFAPAGLGQWTTDPANAGDPVPSVPIAGVTGVVIASSFRPSCNATGATAPCLDDSPGVTDIDDFCNQNATVTCWDATGEPGSQNVVNGLQFIRSYPTAPHNGTSAPVLRTAYFRPNGGCEPYVNSVPTSCFPSLHVEVDLGNLRYDPPGPAASAPLTANDVQVRYRIERANGSDDCANYGVQCDVAKNNPAATGTVSFATTGSGSSPHPPVLVDSWGNAVSLEVRVRNTINLTGGDCSNYNDNCRWFYTATGAPSPSVPPTDAQVLGAPIQRSFMGSVDRTGPLRWLRLDIDPNCNTDATDRVFGWADPPPTLADAASQPAGSSPCYIVNLGLQGGMARDQDEPPIALLLGSGPSQRALVDCDPDTAHGQVEDEIRDGCTWPPYTGNKFDDPPGKSGWCPWSDDTPGSFFTLPKPAPFDDWGTAFDCVLTRTGNATQLMKGFNQRLFGVNNNPVCPTDDGSKFQPGRNYWHRANNSNRRTGSTGTATHQAIRSTTAARSSTMPTSARVNLFFTPYGSFTASGNEVQELVGLGNFYITGYGFITGGGLVIEDPCSDGAGFGGYPYTANEPPPDLDTSQNTAVIWGHFIKDVPGGSIGGTGDPCQPQLTLQSVRARPDRVTPSTVHRLGRMMWCCDVEPHVIPRIVPT